MRKPGAHGFKGWASVISGVICALLVSVMAAATARVVLPA